MDPEQTFLRVHARLSGMLTPRFRLALEYIYLTVAVALFCLLVVMHTNFVQQPGCSGELAGIEFTEAQLVQIKIVSGGLLTPNTDKQNMEDSQNQGTYIESSISPGLKQYEFTVLTAKFWSNWIGSGARRSKLIFKSWKSDKEIIESQVENVVNTAFTRSVPGEIGIIDDAEELQREILNSARESFKAAVINFGSKWKTYLSSFWKYLRQFVEKASQLWNTADWKVFLNVTECLHKLLWEPIKSSVVLWFEKKSKTIEPTYLYTVEKDLQSKMTIGTGHESRGIYYPDVVFVSVATAAFTLCSPFQWHCCLGHPSMKMLQKRLRQSVPSIFGVFKSLCES